MGKAWGNALGGYRKQSRDKGGRFGHGATVPSLPSMSVSPKKSHASKSMAMTKGQRRYVAYQDGKKKERNKRIAQAAVAVAAIGAVGYVGYRSYQGTKTATPIDMHPVTLSATRGARGKVRSPDGKIRPLKLKTRPRELLVSPDGSTTTRAILSSSKQKLNSFSI